MNSHIANLYLALLNIISNLTYNENEVDIKYFKFVDQDYGQLEFHTGDNRPPVSWPCCLIDVSAVKYANLGEHVQTGDVTVTLRLGFPPFSGTANITDEAWRLKALNYYNLEQVVHKALHHIHPVLLDNDDNNVLEDIFGKFQRISATTERRDDFIRVRELTYTIAFEDYTTKGQLQYVPATPIITESFTFPEE